jgi:putative colanic acid biosynthesis acetyltransferase WcaF
MMQKVQLSSYDNSRYSPGRGIAWQLLWFFFGLPLLRSALVPFTGLRVKLLRAFGAQIGQGVVIKPGVRVKYPWRLRVGNDCWIGEDAWIDNIASVTFGNDVCISQRSYFCTGNHDWTDPAFSLRERPIRIGNGAWIGAQALVGPGVIVGDGAVLTAGSVANRDIPPYDVHAGNPATFVRARIIKTPTASIDVDLEKPEVVCESYS